jgi:hypothetical protein
MPTGEDVDIALVCAGASPIGCLAEAIRAEKFERIKMVILHRLTMEFGLNNKN